MNWSDSLKQLLITQLQSLQSHPHEIINTFNIPILLLSDKYVILESNFVIEKITNLSRNQLQGAYFTDVSKFYTHSPQEDGESIHPQNNEAPEFTQRIDNSLGEQFTITWQIHRFDKPTQQMITILLIGKIETQLLKQEIEEKSMRHFSELVSNTMFFMTHPNQQPNQFVHSFDILKKIAQNLPGAGYIKDIEYRYLDGNDYMLNSICGFLTRADLIGKDDYFLNKGIGNRWPEKFYASIRSDDQRVMEFNQPLINKLEPPFISTDGKIIIQSATKIPIIGNNNTINGLFGLSIDISEQFSYLELYSLYHQLHPSKIEAHKNFLQHVVKNTAFNVLTVKELECVLQLSAGNSIKHAAKQLNISPRTIEVHLASAKEKMGCHTKTDLIKLLLNSQNK